MYISRRNLLRNAALFTTSSLSTTCWADQPTDLPGPRVIGLGTVGPDIHNGATPAAIPDGPFQATWQSMQRLYRPPHWFNEAKFGIFIHWGLYSVPAYHNEWYARHMYGAFAQWHTNHFGPPDKFGYKDFIPLFTARNFDPDSWAELFKKSGAKYVVPVAEHHDGFAMWDSALTPWCAGKMGPKRDIIGDLAHAIRKQNMVFGVSSHRMEHHDFMYPTTKVKTDLFDPRYAGFYGPPVPGDMNDGNASVAFQNDWLARCQELIDKYEPQMLWFDNGVNSRSYDRVKLECAAYYYNRALRWHKEVTISTKGTAYLAGSVTDFEKSSRGPKSSLGGCWQIDDQIADNSWGYVSNLHYRTVHSIIGELIDTVSKGGNLLLNISPKADGTIPEEQREILLGIGAWLDVNGEAIYGSEPWKPFSDRQFHFTTKKNVLYALGDQSPAVIPFTVLGQAAKVTRVRMLGQSANLLFSISDSNLIVDVPRAVPNELPFVLKLSLLEI